MRSPIASGILLTAVLCLANQVVAQDTKPPFTEEVQGEWHVLTAHRHNRNIAAGKRVGSIVTISADRLIWVDPEDSQTPLVLARCERVASDESDPKQRVDPNELSSTVRGSLCPEQGAEVAARWRITEEGILLALVEVAEFSGKRNGTYSGAAPADVILVCQREPVPDRLEPDAEADAKRLVGKWVRLAELDDANSSRTRPDGTVEFTAGEFFKRGSKNPKVKPQMDGTWKVQSPQHDRGRIDLIFRSGIEGNQGRSPSLYSFYGDDLLMIVYPEGGWPRDAVEDQARRQPPTLFGSDGDRNMWILRRQTD